MRATLVAFLPLAALSAAVGGDAAQTPPPVFGASVEGVYVDAFVTHRGRQVAGLRAADFELKDNGVVQRLELLATDASPLLAVLAFDVSGSVAGEKLAALQAAGGAFLDSLRLRDAAGLLAFRQKIEWIVEPTTDRDALRTALGELEAGGATSMLDALYAAILLPGTQTRSLVVLFSDGQDNLSWLDQAQVRLVAERSNAVVYMVAIRRQPTSGLEPTYIRELREIAEVTGGRFSSADSPSQLASAFAAIARAMNERYVLRYEPQGVTRAGWHRIQLRLRGRSGDVVTRHGYWIGSR